MKKLFAILPFLVIAASTYITLSGRWIALDINLWQAKLTGNINYFPVLTIFLLALPPLLVLLLYKFLVFNIMKKKGKRNHF